MSNPNWRISLPPTWDNHRQQREADLLDQLKREQLEERIAQRKFNKQQEQTND
jgi:hypothetical protein